MMNYHVLTLFPQMILEGLHTSIIGRAIEAGHITLEAVNIRDFAYNKHQKVDDYPYGGGAGMVMQAEPVKLAYDAVWEKIQKRQEQHNEKKGRPRVIYLTPQGQTFHQKLAQDLAKEEDLIFLCGHYEGIDERVLEEIVTDYVSIGDYVLTGGELPAMVLIDSISRMVPGVLNNEESAQTESFSENLLEYPQYSRPEIWNGKKVPQVLLDGDHKKISQWRKEQSILRTLERRPDLLPKAGLSQKEISWLGTQKNLRAKIKEYISLWEESPVAGGEQQNSLEKQKEILKLLPKGKKIDWNFIFFCFEEKHPAMRMLALSYLEENAKGLNPNAIGEIKKILLGELSSQELYFFQNLIKDIYQRYPELHKILERWKKEKNSSLSSIAWEVKKEESENREG